jgi:hypothetical protein
MGRARRAALADIQGRGKALEVDLLQVARQNFSHHTHTLEHGASQSQIDFYFVEKQQIDKLFIWVSIVQLFEYVDSKQYAET